MQLGLDVGVHSTELLSFMKQLGIEWICTTLPTTHGQAVDSSLTKDVVLKGFDGSNGGIGGPPGGLFGPWKKEELADLLLKVQNAGMRLGSLNENQVWKNLQYFLKAVIPVAEKYSVRLAQHPNDLPVLSYRGIAQPFAIVDHWKRLVNLGQVITELFWIQESLHN
jgi:hypothetical protein